MSEEDESFRDEKGKFLHKNLYHLMRVRIGRPLKIETPEILAEKAIEYFEWSEQCDKGKFTFAGLRFYIGFSRENWSKYKQRPDFIDTMNQIETILEDFYEKKLGWAGSTQGAIFWLKNKAGWRDESTVNENITNVTANFGTTIQPPSESGTDTPSDK